MKCILKYSGYISNHIFDINHPLFWDLYKKIHFNLSNPFPETNSGFLYTSYQKLIINWSNYLCTISSTFIENTFCNAWYNYVCCDVSNSEYPSTHKARGNEVQSVYTESPTKSLRLGEPIWFFSDSYRWTESNYHIPPWPTAY